MIFELEDHVRLLMCISRTGSVKKKHSGGGGDFAMPIITQDRDYVNKHIFVGN